MRYLLDVNALIAIGLESHSQHDRVARWIKSHPENSYLTCSITELGFVRIIAQIPEYRTDVRDARNLLVLLKQNTRVSIEFVADSVDISALPPWVQTPSQTTDGHLTQLAERHGATLATMDRGIPGSFQIPAIPA